MENEEVLRYNIKTTNKLDDVIPNGGSTQPPCLFEMPFIAGSFQPEQHIPRIKYEELAGITCLRSEIELVSAEQSIEDTKMTDVTTKDLDIEIEQLNDCKQLQENQVKHLCEMVRRIYRTVPAFQPCALC